LHRAEAARVIAAHQLPATAATATPAHVGTAAPGCPGGPEVPGRSAVAPKPAQVPAAAVTNRKPPATVKSPEAPKERKSAAHRASGGKWSGNWPAPAGRKKKQVQSVGELPEAAGRGWRVQGSFDCVFVRSSRTKTSLRMTNQNDKSKPRGPIHPGRRTDPSTSLRAGLGGCPHMVPLPEW